jgi:soluble lytic murein transglycosylase
MRRVQHAALFFSLLILTSLLLPVRSSAKGPDGKESFRAALRMLEDNDYGAAIESFKAARRDLPIIGDYTMLYLSKAYLKAGKTGQSTATLDRMLKRYPESPARQEAARTAIKTASYGDWDRAIERLEPYVEDFPRDEEMKFMLADLLKKRGRLKRAKPLLREIYIGGGKHSKEAYEALASRQFSTEEIHERANNLMRKMDFTEAEKTLRERIEKTEGPPGEEFLRKLGLCLFMQKKYGESARVHLRTGDLYIAAKAFLRAGDVESFEKTLDDLIDDGDEDAVALLVANSMEKHGRGKTEEALKQLSRAIARFPSNAEKARWQTGWIHYMKKDYLKAAGVFSDLHESYRSDKYLYWKARSLEKAGLDATPLYKEIVEDDYYAFLARKKTGPAATASMKRNSARTVKLPMKRIDTLIEVGLLGEAAAELGLAARKTRRYNVLIAIAYKLKAIRRYPEAMLLMTRVPDGRRPEELLYPLAYWQTVTEVSSDYGLDPYLILSLIREESRFDAEALSSAGAMGLMQLMPRTARRTAGKLKLKMEDVESIYDAGANIRLGTHYLYGLFRKFDSVPAALAAYNAGKNKVMEWLERGRYGSYDEFVEDIPYRETRNYVKRILASYHRYREANYPRPEAGPHRL